MKCLGFFSKECQQLCFGIAETACGEDRIHRQEEDEYGLKRTVMSAQDHPVSMPTSI